MPIPCVSPASLGLSWGVGREMSTCSQLLLRRGFCVWGGMSWLADLQASWSVGVVTRAGRGDHGSTPTPILLAT